MCAYRKLDGNTLWSPLKGETKVSGLSLGSAFLERWSLIALFWGLAGLFTLSYSRSSQSRPHSALHDGQGLEQRQILLNLLSEMRIPPSIAVSIRQEVACNPFTEAEAVCVRELLHATDRIPA